ncbi:hypothetical protein FAES_1861 [Fibrella aestuarina BUZ 2]|uniref:DUF2693 domain-containing protein n=1 Tax=Fibrella aestuarina BUZ 2 TaxID=1166018 RepID=I0K6W7_9BACT|nr:SH3 beta-barrel fold-containing protein [Fibrella aestuarina]CCG99870.1 hypothetical protein FAES_1861 [Fibrella aestuarina BUZ 2]
MKRQLFHLAHSLRATGLSMADALKRAWQTIKLKAQMLVTPTRFTYVKEDGSERTAIGYYGAAPVVEGGKAENLASLAIRYFDTEVNGWRSFRADRLVIG